MKILISGYHNPHFITVTEYIEQALRALGHELHIHDNLNYVIPGRIRDRIPCLHRMDVRRINSRLIDIADRTRPDLALITGGENIQRETVEALNSKGIVTVLWTIDPPHHFDTILSAAPCYRHIFCQGTEAVELLSMTGITNAHWLPMGCDPVHHHPVTMTESEMKEWAHDVVFVGSFYPFRAALFEPLVNFDIAIWGPGWEGLNRESPLRQKIMGAHTRPSEWLKIYSASKIVLATHYRDAQNRFPVYQASPRIFEAMSCGAFLISDRQRDVFSLFKDGEHLVGFDDADDLMQKVRHFLTHPDERKSIAERGKSEVQSNHTYLDRVKKMFTVIKARK